MKTVKEVSEITRISTRTLRYYDEISCSIWQKNTYRTKNLPKILKERVLNRKIFHYGLTLFYFFLPFHRPGHNTILEAALEHDINDNNGQDGNHHPGSQ